MFEDGASPPTSLVPNVSTAVGTIVVGVELGVLVGKELGLSVGEADGLLLGLAVGLLVG